MERFQGPKTAPKTTQDRPKTAPRRSSRASFFDFVFVFDLGPSWVAFWPHLGPPLGAKSSRGAPPQRFQNDLKLAKPTQDRPRRPQDRPRCLQDPPRPLQDAPRGAQDPPKTPQNDPKSSQHTPQTIKNRPKTQTKEDNNTTQHTQQHNNTTQHTQHNSTRLWGGATLLGASWGDLGMLEM